MLRDDAFDIGAIYERFAALRLERGDDAAIEIGDARCRVHVRRFQSADDRYLPAEDRGQDANQAFDFPVFVPARGSAAPRALVVLHGLNETYYQKLVPWAYAYTVHAGAPSLIFPMAYYLNRRPPALYVDNNVFIRDYKRRRTLPGNAYSSPFNSTRSGRLDARPERLFGEMLQSYRDLRRIAAAARAGTLAPLPAGTRLDFLGYSLGGYLSLMLLASDPDGLFAESRVLLFASGGPVDAARGRPVDPRSILILDTLASLRAVTFVRAVIETLHDAPDLAAALARARERHGDDAPRIAALLETLGADDFQAMRAGVGAFAAGRRDLATTALLQSVAKRVTAIGSAEDTVIPLSGIEENLAGVVDPVRAITTGNHEYPFNLATVLPPEFERFRKDSREEYQALTRLLQATTSVEPAYRASFSRLIETAAEMTSAS
jgi:pimeloyl-ACP methyl ester carboxylesterase